jgi:2-hydroxychromene-2-carboxylate isomerase
MKQNTIDFYFDFASPYGYFAAEMIEEFAARHKRQTAWHPMLLGAVFKVTGGKPLTDQAIKSDYAWRDFRRSAAYYGIPFKTPTAFPIATINTCRAALWMQEKHPAHAKKFMLELFRAYFRGDCDIGKLGVIGDVAKGLGYDADEVIAAAQTDDVKAKLKAAVDEAMAKGVFGAPFVVVDGEPFWGADRFAMMEQWITKGAWSY